MSKISTDTSDWEDVPESGGASDWEDVPGSMSSEGLVSKALEPSMLGRAFEESKPALKLGATIAGAVALPTILPSVAPALAAARGAQWLAPGMGAVMGSLAGKAALTPGEFTSRPAEEQVREQVVNLLSGMLPAGGKMARSIVGKMTGADMTRLLGLLTQMGGIGGTQAAIGQGANVLTGQPVNIAQAVLEGTTAGALEGILKPAEVAVFGGVRPSAPGVQAAKRVGVYDQLPSALFEEAGSPRANLLEFVGPGGSARAMTQASELADKILKQRMQETLPMPTSSEIAETAKQVGVDAAFRQKTLMQETANAMQKNISEGTTALDVPALALEARKMNAQVAAARAAEDIGAVNPALVGVAVEKPSTAYSPALNSVINARRNSGARIGAAVEGLQKVVGDVPVNILPLGAVAKETLDELNRPGVPGISAKLKGIVTRIAEEMPGAKKPFTPGTDKVFSLTDFADKLSLLKKEYRAMSRQEGNRNAARLMLSLVDKGDDVIRTAVQNSERAKADPKAASDALQAWDSARGDYRDLNQLETAYLKAEEGGVTNPKKLATQIKKALPKVSPKVRASWLKGSLEFGSTPEANLAVAIPSANFSEGVISGFKEGNPAAIQLIRKTPGGEEAVVNSLLREAVQSVPSASGISIPALQRKGISELFTKYPDLENNLSAPMLGKLQSIMLQREAVMPELADNLGRVATAMQKGNKARGIADLMLPEKTSVETLQNLPLMQIPGAPGIPASREMPGRIGANVNTMGEKGIDVSRLSQFTRGAREQAYTPGAPSGAQLLETMTPRDAQNFLDLGDVATVILENTKNWPSESLEPLGRIIKQNLSAGGAGATQAGALGATGIAKTAAGGLAALSWIGYPQMLKQLALTLRSPKDLNKAAMIFRAIRMLQSKAAEKVGGAK